VKRKAEEEEAKKKAAEEEVRQKAAGDEAMLCKRLLL
jgi:hypothetical protein